MHTISSGIGLNPFFIRTEPFVQLAPLCTARRYPKVFSVSGKIPSANCFSGLQSPVCPVLASKEGAATEVDFEDFVEKDWSFLDSDYSNGDGDLMRKMDRIISAGNLKETSRVLVSLGSEAFVDKLVSSSTFGHLLVVHDSLMILASIKEKYDQIKCWQGELTDVPKKWTPFDVVFLYFLPGLPLGLHQILASLTKICSPGAMVVISHPQGKHAAQEQKQRFPDVVVSSLPEEKTLLQIAADHLYQVVETVDEEGFYLSVLKLNEHM